MRWPKVLDETFEAIVLDWNAAAWDRRMDAGGLRRRVESLCAAGVHVFVLAAPDVGEIDVQLRARPSGRGRLHLCCSDGEDVFEVGPQGPLLVARRTPSPLEQSALDRAAALTAEQLRARGLDARVLPDRDHRRTIELASHAEAARRAGTRDGDVPRGEASGRVAAPEIERPFDVMDVASEAARTARLDHPRVKGDAEHLAISLTDMSDSARFAAGWLAERGITGRLVLVITGAQGLAAEVPGAGGPMLVDAFDRARVVSIGVEPGGVPDGVTRLAGGSGRLLEMLDAQLERRAAHRVPQVDDDPRWVVALPRGPATERVAEALGALANGRAGTRGSKEDPGPASMPLFAVAGAYDDDGHLLHGPPWTGLAMTARERGHGGRRLVDLRTGTLARVDGPGGFRSLRFVSIASPHAMGLRAEGPAAGLVTSEAVAGPGPHGTQQSARGGTSVACAGRGEQQIAVAFRDRRLRASATTVVERLAAWETGAPGQGVSTRASQRLTGVSEVGFDALLAEHRACWAERWSDAQVVIEGGPDAEADQLAARFAVFHLLSAAAEHGEAAVSARGLTGDAYGGHVFWDADVFVLPALAAIRPSAARAMLEYRIRRLPAARAEAAARGSKGARFPWESASGGADVTPRVVRGSHGESIPIATGMHEEHIVADVAWAAVRYAEWTGDEAFLSVAPGRDLVVDTARYWASRVRLGPAGRGHLYGVMGPDEYHEVVDDNAYTNVMARWNLEQGAALLEATGRAEDADEAGRWRHLAAALVDGWDPTRSLYEQFAGYFGLEPLLMRDVAQPPVAIDMVLGAERVARSQLIKQADVLMLHHLVPTAVVGDSLVPCLDFYEPRTAHGSSLSPAISASLLARAGRPDAALELYRVAARLDLDDLTGTTAGGLHLATMGGLWQALAYGFLGLRAQRDGLVVDPHLPESWSALSMRFRFRGERFMVRATHDDVDVSCDTPMPVQLPGREVEEHHAPGVILTLPEPPPAERSRP